MAVIEDAHIRTRLATMLEDPRVQVGLLLPQGYCGLVHVLGRRAVVHVVGCAE